MPEVINYKMLLLKYMVLIQHDEGIDYLDKAHEVTPQAMRITPEELTVLEFVSRVAHIELGRG